MSGGAVSIAVIMTLGLLTVIAVRGLAHFWPADLVHASYNVPGMANHLVIGESVQKEQVPRERLKGAGLPVPDNGPEFMTRERLRKQNIDPDQMPKEEFEAALAEVKAQTDKEHDEVRAMPGNLAFRAFLDPEGTEAVCVLHEWADADGDLGMRKRAAKGCDGLGVPDRPAAGGCAEDDGTRHRRRPSHRHPGEDQTAAAD